MNTGIYRISQKSIKLITTIALCTVYYQWLLMVAVIDSHWFSFSLLICGSNDYISRNTMRIQRQKSSYKLVLNVDVFLRQIVGRYEKVFTVNTFQWNSPKESLHSLTVHEWSISKRDGISALRGRGELPFCISCFLPISFRLLLPTDQPVPSPHLIDGFFSVSRVLICWYISTICVFYVRGAFNRFPEFFCIGI